MTEEPSPDVSSPVGHKVQASGRVGNSVVAMQQAVSGVTSAKACPTAIAIACAAR